MHCLSCGMPQRQTFPSSQVAHHWVLQSYLTSCTSIFMVWAHNMGKCSCRLPLLCNPCPILGSCLRLTAARPPWCWHLSSPSAFGWEPKPCNGDKWETQAKLGRSCCKHQSVLTLKPTAPWEGTLQRWKKAFLLLLFWVLHSKGKHIASARRTKQAAREGVRIGKSLWGLSAHMWLHTLGSMNYFFFMELKFAPRNIILTLKCLDQMKFQQVIYFQ